MATPSAPLPHPAPPCPPSPGFLQQPPPAGHPTMGGCSCLAHPPRTVSHSPNNKSIHLPSMLKPVCVPAVLQNKAQTPSLSAIFPWVPSLGTILPPSRPTPFAAATENPRKMLHFSGLTQVILFARSPLPHLRKFSAGVPTSGILHYPPLG